MALIHVVDFELVLVAKSLIFFDDVAGICVLVVIVLSSLSACILLSFHVTWSNVPASVRRLRFLLGDFLDLLLEKLDVVLSVRWLFDDARLFEALFIKFKGMADLSDLLCVKFTRLQVNFRVGVLLFE